MNLKKLKDKRLLVLGLGKEGISTLRFLRKVFPKKFIGIADQKTARELELRAKTAIAKDTKLKLHLGKKYQKALNFYDVVFRSPGISVSEYKAEKITSQTKLFVEAFNNKIIGITGTKGKTTTTSLIYKILKD